MPSLSHIILFSFISLLQSQEVLALGQNATIGFNASSASVFLANRTAPVQVLLDDADWPGVWRVSDDLAADFGRVTGLNGSVAVSNCQVSEVNASMIFNLAGKHGRGLGGSSNSGGGVIISGTIGKSILVDTLVQAGKIDVSTVQGKWEAFASCLVSNPISGVANALVIAGTIYGLYDISEQIRVSPWYYWTDVPPKPHSSIYALATRKIQGPPNVKYRGFFLNDEAPALTGYINAKYPPSPWGPGFNADFYATVFELLLGLRANYLWPAQWNSMFNVDDARSQPLADEYGIVMGTSHTEPMMRATKEWSEFGNGTWQWNTNNASIYPFFVEGAERAKPYEGVMTMGMRGYGDTALSSTIETAELEDIVSTQRQILKDVYGSETGVPQMWCLCNEVQGYYEAGMRVPDDVTLLWTDDFFHFDFVGDPQDYKWINIIQLQKTWEQMHLAYERKAREIWIVNVGDLKPLEIPINHFFDLAYDINAWDVHSTPHWLELWAT
ncbi:glycoside hydrolase family 115 protein [Saccharata proteae CBS 121410]|uniref:Glycoside hydrolase family 115 protein n=1 Tax=Saccharata proteae CBS 121410 TaxID=1314787 RepID=A0A9P4I0C5_9PEZI|nr:glycoside hydrolase family 115 protein [Saccharata proteae CBS 121410]